jgi:hypothetical protein
VPAEDVNIVRMVAKCRACQSVFAFQAQLSAEPPPTAAPAPHAATTMSAIATVPMPPGIEVHREASAAAGDYRTAHVPKPKLRIVRRWFAFTHLVVLGFAFFWNLFVGVWMIRALVGNAETMAIFAIPHFVVGIVLLYVGLTGLLNRTVIEIDRGTLTVRHGPIPAWGNRDIPVHELKQLFTLEKRGGKGGRSYELLAVAHTGPTITLAKGMTDPQQALYLERLIEEHLEIEDQAVLGEYRG